jgi:hypothetical protein
MSTTDLTTLADTVVPEGMRIRRWERDTDELSIVSAKFDPEKWMWNWLSEGEREEGEAGGTKWSCIEPDAEPWQEEKIFYEEQSDRVKGTEGVR